MSNSEIHSKRSNTHGWKTDADNKTKKIEFILRFLSPGNLENNNERNEDTNKHLGVYMLPWLSVSSFEYLFEALQVLFC